jgi:hypothetical protein
MSKEEAIYARSKRWDDIGPNKEWHCLHLFLQNSYVAEMLQKIIVADQLIFPVLFVAFAFQVEGSTKIREIQIFWICFTVLTDLSNDCDPVTLDR